MVSGPTTDIFVEYQGNDGKTLGIKRFVKDGVKMVTVNDIELTLDSLISMILDVDVVEAPRDKRPCLGEGSEDSEDSEDSGEGSAEASEASESDSSFAQPDPDTDSDYEESESYTKDVMTQSQEDFKNLLTIIISIYVAIVSIIAALIFTDLIR